MVSHSFFFFFFLGSNNLNNKKQTNKQTTSLNNHSIITHANTLTLKLIDVAMHMPPIVMATDKLPFNKAFLTSTLNNNILVVAKKVMHSKQYPIIENVKKLTNDSNGSSAVEP